MNSDKETVVQLEEECMLLWQGRHKVHSILQNRVVSRKARGVSVKGSIKSSSKDNRAFTNKLSDSETA